MKNSKSIIILKMTELIEAERMAESCLCSANLLLIYTQTNLVYREPDRVFCRPLLNSLYGIYRFLLAKMSKTIPGPEKLIHWKKVYMKTDRVLNSHLRLTEVMDLTNAPLKSYGAAELVADHPVTLRNPDCPVDLSRHEYQCSATDKEEIEFNEVTGAEAVAAVVTAGSKTEEEAKKDEEENRDEAEVIDNSPVVNSNQALVPLVKQSACSKSYRSAHHDSRRKNCRGSNRGNHGGSFCGHQAGSNRCGHCGDYCHVANRRGRWRGRGNRSHFGS